MHPFHKFIYAPGGLLTSVREHTKYLVMNMNEGVYKDNRLVDKASLEAMHQPYVDVPKGFFGNEGYGYGWRITEDFLGHKLISHGGSTGVSSAYVGFVPDLKIGVALAANTSPYGSALMTWGALALLMGKNPEKELPFMPIEERMNQLVGKYEGYKGLRRIQVVKKGPMLYLEEQTKYSDTSIPLIPEKESIEDYRFHIYTSPGVKMQAEFVVNSEKSIELYLERWRLHKVAA